MTTQTTFEFLRIERDGGIRTLILDRPPLNVLHIPMLRELGTAMAALAEDEAAKLLVLTGAGKAFCAGVDVADHTAERVHEMLDLFHTAVRRMLALDFPVIAAVNGAALGGGCELVLGCDLVLAREGAKLGQPEIRLGSLPPVAAVMLPRLVGRQRALDLVLSGRTIEAEEARDMGFVTRVLAADDFAGEVEAYVDGLASLSLPVLRLAKQAVLEGMVLPFEQALQRTEEIYLGQLVKLHDAHEGLAAFLEKRAPVWRDE
jgi:cyclohexa-1,5-dienecarbonyl-CoA hydratase